MTVVNTFTFSTHNVVMDAMRDLVTPGALRASSACSDVSSSAKTDIFAICIFFS